MIIREAQNAGTEAKTVEDRVEGADHQRRESKLYTGHSYRQQYGKCAQRNGDQSNTGQPVSHRGRDGRLRSGMVDVLVRRTEPEHALVPVNQLDRTQQVIGAEIINNINSCFVRWCANVCQGGAVQQDILAKR